MGNFKDIYKRLRIMALWQEMRIFWVILPDIVVIFALSWFYIPIPAIIIQTLFLFIIAATLLVGIYKAANVDRQTNIERNELRSMVAGLADALIVYDQDFRALYWNMSAEKLFRISADSVVGHVFEPRDVENPMWR